MPEPLIDIPTDPQATCDRCGRPDPFGRLRRCQCSFAFCTLCFFKHSLERTHSRRNGGYAFCDRVIEAAWTHAIFRITEDELHRYGRDLTDIDQVVLAMLTDADWAFARGEYGADLYVGPRC